MIVTCKECGRAYTVSEPKYNKGFCSYDCREKYLERKLSTTKAICHHCKKEYTPTRVNQKYCSETCRYESKLKRDQNTFAQKMKLKNEKRKPEYCKRKEKCYYGATTSGIWYCKYLEIEKQPRGCLGSECDKYRPRGRRRYNPYSQRYEEVGGSNAKSKPKEK